MHNRVNFSISPTGCWIAVRSKHRGYTSINVDKVQHQLHRFSYEQFVGPIEKGLTLDHLCRVRDCINPSHLEPVTMKVNVLRGDTITAAHANKTHCLRGHPLVGDNLYIRKGGGRRCKACNRSYYHNA